ncbi:MULTISPECIES: helix-turn-helix domain-containing protein [Acinetobacter]|uniref:helix-turn-helix domain-containing protein n=1 Tax=Acinetobacter TaxID=469 RepID=UPI00203710F2|nr:helix-turn-helix transcriptional regulator [Acinetobacter sp. C32I]USA55629.1 helix-turn-helix transcriptional regulator [Acinetobacter sp. C32I]
MIKCKLSNILGERKLKVSDVARATGINRNTLYNMYKEETVRLEIDVLDKLCEFFNCNIEDLLEFHPNE